MKILIVDQFSGWSPAQFAGKTVQFSALVAAALAQRQSPSWFAPVVLDVDPETYRLPWSTTAFKENAEGHAEFWRCHWDSSG